MDRGTGSEQRLGGLEDRDQWPPFSMRREGIDDDDDDDDDDDNNDNEDHDKRI